MKKYLTVLGLTSLCLSTPLACAQTTEDVNALQLKNMPSLADFPHRESNLNIVIDEPIEPVSDVIEDTSTTTADTADTQTSITIEEQIVVAGEAIAEAALGAGEVGVVIETSATNPQMPFKNLDIFAFDLTRSNIKKELLLQTGKYPWEIPVVIQPKFTTVEDVRHDLSDGDYLILVEVNGEVKAYPLKIMNWHRGINDVIGGKNVFVVWDPFSGNATAFERDMRGRTMIFGDSGMMYSSSIVYFDDVTKSLWIPSLGRAVTGKMAPKKVSRIPVVITQYKKLKQTHPYAKVLSFDLPSVIDVNYAINPLGNYAREGRLIYPAFYENEAMARKEPVLGVTLHRAGHSIDVAFKVNALLEMQSPGRLEFNFEVGHHPSKPTIPMNIELGENFGEFKITSLPDVEIETQYSYWFSWIILHPESYIVKELP